MFKKILWATDGSESADRALAYAKTLAARDGATLVVVHSVEHIVGPRAGGFPVHADEEELKAKVKRQVEELAADGVDVTSKVVGGSSGAAHMIADVAGDVGADLIVVGTRGHTPIAGLMLGGVTQRLLHIASCPVLAVPPVKQVAPREHGDTQDVGAA
jgi:nucleotide-binding universal stress UspA family protein